MQKNLLWKNFFKEQAFIIIVGIVSFITFIIIRFVIQDIIYLYLALAVLGLVHLWVSGNAIYWQYKRKTSKEAEICSEN